MEFSLQPDRTMIIQLWRKNEIIAMATALAHAAGRGVLAFRAQPPVPSGRRADGRQGASMHHRHGDAVALFLLRGVSDINDGHRISERLTRKRVVAVQGQLAVFDPGDKK